MAFADGNIIIGTSVDVGGLNTGLAKIEKSFNKLGRLASLALGVAALYRFGKAAINAASDLEQVQNQVDVSFEDMVYKVENFANVAIAQFGMSEFAAKQTAASYMAMGKAMGFTLDEASDLAVSLTALTGDFASFYNISQEYARVALSAVYSGETETLKRYGIVLTEANLQAFAYSKGINQNVKNMNARNKAALRYMYILETTKDMQGDFVRTQKDWANQGRLLQENWKEFLITVGNGVTTVFAPLLAIVNELVQKLTKFTQLVGYIIAKLFGIDLSDDKDELEGLGDAAADAAEGEDELADSIEAAAKAAKKAIAPFDELNNLTTSSTSGDSGYEDLELPDIELPEGAEAVNELLDELLSKINTLYEFGQFLAGTVANIINGINWDGIYEKLGKIGTGAAEFLNGAISSDLFVSVGKHLADSINAGINLGLTFAKEFDWSQFGKKVIDGVNAFIDNLDMASVAEHWGTFAIGIVEALETAFNNVDWSAAFNAIGDFLSAMTPEMWMAILKLALLKKTISILFSGVIFSAIGDGVKAGFKALGKTIAKYISPSAILGALKGAAKSVLSSVSGFFVKVGMVIKNVINGWDLAGSINAAFGAGIGDVAVFIGGIVSTIGGMVLAVKEFFDMWSGGWSVLKTILEALGLALAGIGSVLLGAPAAIAAAIAGIVFAVSQIAIVIHDNWETIKAGFGTAIEWIKTNLIDKVCAWFVGAWETITTLFSTIGAWVNEHIVQPVSAVLTPIIEFVSKIFEGIWIFIQAWLLEFKEQFIDPVANLVKGLIDLVVGVVKGVWDDISTIWNKFSSWLLDTAFPKISRGFKEAWNDITGILQDFKQFMEHTFGPIFETIAELASAAWENIKTAWKGLSTWFSMTVTEPFCRVWDAAVGTVRDMFEGLWDSVVNGVKTCMNTFIGVVEKVLNTLINKINGVIGNFNELVDWAADKVGVDWTGVPTIKNISIPKLATGSVVPPNKPFMAMLGDNTQETEVVSPLSTMKDAMISALSESGVLKNQDNCDIIINIDGREVFRAVRAQDSSYRNRTGRSAFAY